MDFTKAVNSFFEAEYNKKKILKEIKLKYLKSKKKMSSSYVLPTYQNYVNK